MDGLTVRGVQMPTPEQRFREWKKSVDQYLLKTVGLSSDGLPDIDYWSYWNRKKSPKSTAKAAIRNAKKY